MVEAFELGSGSSSADPEGALSGTPTLPKAQQMRAAIVRALAREGIRELCEPAIGGGHLSLVHNRMEDVLRDLANRSYIRNPGPGGVARGPGLCDDWSMDEQTLPRASATSPPTSSSPSSADVLSAAP